MKPVLDGGAERELRGRIIVNASGPWFDRVAARLESTPAPRLRTTKGVHIACESFTNHAIFLESAVDGRAVFAIPWMGHTWIGTTDTDFDDDPSTASATDEDVRYLIESLAPQLPVLRSVKQHWTTAGVRALVRSDGSPSGVSRMHRITTETSGLVSVLGGKLTGYRAIAEEVVDRVCGELQVSARSTTATTPLPGGGGERSGVAASGRDLRLAGDAGPGARRCDPALARPLAPGYPDIAAEVVYSARHEWCERVDDFLLRRSYLGFRSDRGTGRRPTHRNGHPGGGSSGVVESIGHVVLAKRRIDPTSASTRPRLTFAGLPITRDRGGTWKFSGSRLPAATIDSAPTLTPFSRIAPIPIRQRSSMVQPWTIAACPMVTSSPMVVGWVPDWTWTTVPSWTLVLAPIRMAFTSPRMTTFIQTLSLRADVDVADDLGALVDVGGRVDGGRNPAECAQHCRRLYGPQPHGPAVMERSPIINWTSTASPDHNLPC